MNHCTTHLIALFHETFFESHNTVLEGGHSEPLYLAAKDGQPHKILFREDYFRSALHEISHWCIAGERRRLLDDFGYWYAADGRTAQQQAEFECVEVKPQAVEWGFCLAAGIAFSVSTDNLNGEDSDSLPFRKAVLHQCQIYFEQGFPSRAAIFMERLLGFYGYESISAPTELPV